MDANIPRDNTQTEKLKLARAEYDEKGTPEMKKERHFEAAQSWHITVPASKAQTVVDLVVKAGANEVGDVDWDVADPAAL